ncbi:ATP-binding protein [Methylocystis echinoides]|jgi:signal transduction histidine kinase|uniref:sensor histidine kinase n=1 Tax=Methylocystis echinoides TaxID=29468 RepID=UPI00342DE94D
MTLEKDNRSPLSASHQIERLRAEQFSHIARHTPGVMLANICNATVFMAASWDRPYRIAALCWGALVIAIASFVFLRRKTRRTSTYRPAASSSRRGVYRAVGYAAALGSCWGALPLLFLDQASVGGKLLIACLCSGMLGGGAFVLASIPPAAAAFSGPIALGSFAALLASGDRDYLLTTIVLAVYSAVLMRAVWNYAEGLERRVKTQVEAESKASERLARLHASGLHALGGMASGLAHEIAQPLAAASAYVETSKRLLREPTSEALPLVERNLQGASEQIGHVGDIVDRLRHFLLEGKPSSSLVHLRSLIEEACRANRRALENANVRVHLRLEATKDAVQADRVQITQVLANLLRNAIDAMEGVSDRSIMIACVNEDDWVRVDVADSGAGVDEGVRESLFEPFMTTKPKGMGVGLAMSRSIVEAHGGRIWMEPNAKAGSTFSFVLPCDRCAEASITT